MRMIGNMTARKIIKSLAAAVLAVATVAGCATEDTDTELPRCTDLGCEFALCQGPDGPCSCRPDPDSEPMLCTRDTDTDTTDHNEAP